MSLEKVMDHHSWRTEPPDRYTASVAFLEALWEAGITHIFANFGSDHPSIMEAMVKAQEKGSKNFPRVITCPHEIAAIAMADGYARYTGKPQCVIVHVDVGTSNLGAIVHDVSVGRTPLLIFAGLSPYTIEGEYRGSRTEYIHWLQDIPDQKGILAQYCRYTGEIKRGANVKQMVNRALSFATSDPKGPVYLVGSREAMEEEITPYSLDQNFWSPVKAPSLSDDQAQYVADLLVNAKEPLIVTGYSGRHQEVPSLLVELGRLIKGLRVLDTGGSDMCFPADEPGWLGLRYGVDDHIKTADLILVLDCDVPWIPVSCRPHRGAKVIHIDLDPLKPLMSVFYIDAEARYFASSQLALAHIIKVVRSNFGETLTSPIYEERQRQRQKEHEVRLQQLESIARPSPDGTFNISYLSASLRRALPLDTIFVVEAVTNATSVSDQLQCTIPGTWINCGGGGLGWSGGASLGVKLASDTEAGGPNKGKFVCQIVGDGSYMFGVPSSVYWISQRYGIPVLTVVLNNNGWNAPRKSLELVHPHGYGSMVSNLDLNISFADSPDYSRIGQAAAMGRCWAGHASSREELDKLLIEAIAAVESGISAILDARIPGMEGRQLIRDVN